jgi:hypothetical protein
MALLALFTADGLHELSHWDGSTAVAPAASGHAEAHAGNCPHWPHVPQHDHHQCLLCQQRTGPHALALPEVPVGADAPLAVAPLRAAAGIAAAPSVSGVLGARGPPLTLA